jgi:predicted transcriptional regulator
MAERGRPAFKPTPALRRKVEELVSCGMSQDDVARAMGISTPTLVKHFEDELANGTAKKRAEIIGMLYKAAKGGNVTAQRKLEEMSRVAGAAEAIKGREKKTPEPGKKEQEKIAADQVSGKFAPPSPPKLVVDNNR